MASGATEIRRWHNAQPADWRAANPIRGGFVSKAVMNAYRAAHGLPTLTGQYPRPADATLLAAVAELGPSQARLGAHFGVPAYVTAGWIKHLRTAGLTDGK